MERQRLDPVRGSSDVEVGLPHGQSAVGDFLESLLISAVERKASDLHFESFKTGMDIRMRILGVLQRIHRILPDVMNLILARLKVVAGLDIQDRFHPQDGRFERTVDGRKIDFRLSLIPTVGGESLVLRILDRSALLPRLDGLGMDDSLLEEMRRILHMNHGLFLILGPTGSGKTTTLYSMLGAMDRCHQKILTVEDPVEYELANLMQSSVDPSAGRTFDRLLRSFLRHDPDKILVGEIRDSETARNAIRAALTGHAVFATLHASTFSNGILRLLGLGVEPFLLASCLRGMVNQRLVKILCPHCSTEGPPSPEEKEILSRLAEMKIDRIRWPVGCKFCGGIGFIRRRAIFDHLLADLAAKNAIASGRLAAIRNHNKLPEIAKQMLVDGETTVRELLENLLWER